MGVIMEAANNNWDKRLEDVNSFFDILYYEKTSILEILADYGRDMAAHYTNWLKIEELNNDK